MEIFDKISEKSQEVASKAKDVFEITKLNTFISREESKKKEQYVEIGKKYAELYSDTAAPEFQEYISIIKEADAKIEDYRNQISEVKGTRICPACGSVLLLDSVFCNKCGIKLPEIVDPEPEPKAEEKAADDTADAPIVNSSIFVDDVVEDVKMAPDEDNTQQ